MSAVQNNKLGKEERSQKKGVTYNGQSRKATNLLLEQISEEVLVKALWTGRETVLQQSEEKF